MYQAATLEKFGGLNLRDDPGEVGTGQAIDCLNVDLGQRGRVKSRAGVARFDVTAGSGAAGPTYLTPARFANTDYLLLCSVSVAPAVYLDRYTVGGSRTAVGNWSAARVGSIARLGTPTAEYAFISTDNDVVGGTTYTLRRYNGSSLATSTGAPRYVAVSPVSNRLVQANFPNAADSPSGSNGSPSTVFFSDAGAPETYSANNYVHLHPGDGEEILALVTWRDLLVVFKRTRAFVFYGESTDATGNPVFNYRTVDLLAAVHTQAGDHLGRPVSVGVKGVYYVSSDGVYRFDGASFTCISDDVRAVFTGPDTAGLVQADVTQTMVLSVAENRVFLRYYRLYDQAERVLVFDERDGQWVLWAMGFSSVAANGPVAWSTTQSTGSEDLYWPRSSNTGIVRQSLASTDDVGTAIVSSYQTGFSDLGSPEDKTIRELLVWGSGSPTVSVAADYATADTGAVVTLGTSPAITQGHQRIARTGTEFSVKFAKTSGAWSVSRTVLNVREVRGAGAKA